jgi:hypothetical protein
MKKISILFLALLVLPFFAFAGGAGGVGYLMNAGSDLLNSLAIPGDAFTVLPTGAANSFSIFGYGVTRSGWKIGGSGSFFYAVPINVPVPVLSGPVTGVIGGFGDVISGGYLRIGPLGLSLNFRFGAGGMAVRYRWSPQSNAATSASTGTFIAHGAVDGEVGIILIPAMMVSVFAGLDVLVIPSAFLPVPVPTMGVRIAWGSF